MTRRELRRRGGLAGRGPDVRTLPERNVDGAVATVSEDGADEQIRLEPLRTTAILLSFSQLRQVFQQLPATVSFIFIVRVGLLFIEPGGRKFFAHMNFFCQSM